MTDDLVKRLRIAADRADTVFDPDFASPWREAADRIEKLEAALTPSSDTKAAYHGEFSFLITVRVEDEETSEPINVERKVMVPWNTIKEIMAAIRDRAALGEKKDG
jgi:hypothetical protein